MISYSGRFTKKPSQGSSLRHRTRVDIVSVCVQYNFGRDRVKVGTLSGTLRFWAPLNEVGISHFEPGTGEEKQITPTTREEDKDRPGDLSESEEGLPFWRREKKRRKERTDPRSDEIG